MIRQKVTGIGPSPRPTTAPLAAIAETPLSPQELAVLAAIRETPYGAVEVVLHQSRIVQIVRTEKMKVDEAPR
ncbi:YezD family protein [Arenimonas composti]|uniref:YezD family protein n=1 Tax=Arenimonas composti TaxID=370776 RepID=UPI000427151E|nr:YezD family protein [Arenimonas composti]